MIFSYLINISLTPNEDLLLYVSRVYWQIPFSTQNSLSASADKEELTELNFTPNQQNAR